jgi:hypothetical protein
MGEHRRKADGRRVFSAATPSRRRPPPITGMAGPMPGGDQLSRQWRLLQMIDRPRGVTIDDAARDLNCTIRTMRSSSG